MRFTSLAGIFCALILPAVASAAIGPLGGQIKYFEVCEVKEDGDDSVDLGESGQLYVGVENASSGGTNRVIFWFYNDGPVNSGISNIVFSDGVLLDLSGIIDQNNTDKDTSNVLLTDESAYHQASGYSDVDFKELAGSSSDATSLGLSAPASAAFEADGINGASGSNFVQPGEDLGIVFRLQGTFTWQDVIDALADGATGNPHLEIGFHVQSIPDGDGDNDASDKYIVCGEPSDTPPDEGPTLPEPTSLAAWILGSAGLGLILRGRMKKAAA